MGRQGGVGGGGGSRTLSPQKVVLWLARLQIQFPGGVPLRDLATEVAMRTHQKQVTDKLKADVRKNLAVPIMLGFVSKAGNWYRVTRAPRQLARRGTRLWRCLIAMLRQYESQKEKQREQQQQEARHASAAAAAHTRRAAFPPGWASGDAGSPFVMSPMAASSSGLVFGPHGSHVSHVVDPSLSVAGVGPVALDGPVTQGQGECGPMVPGCAAAMASAAAVAAAGSGAGQGVGVLPPWAQNMPLEVAYAAAAAAISKRKLRRKSSTIRSGASDRAWTAVIRSTKGKKVVQIMPPECPASAVLSSNAALPAAAQAAISGSRSPGPNRPTSRTTNGEGRGSRTQSSSPARALMRAGEDRRRRLRSSNSPPTKARKTPR